MVVLSYFVFLMSFKLYVTQGKQKGLEQNKTSERKAQTIKLQSELKANFSLAMGCLYNILSSEYGKTYLGKCRKLHSPVSEWLCRKHNILFCSIKMETIRPVFMDKISLMYSSIVNMIRSHFEPWRYTLTVVHVCNKQDKKETRESVRRKQIKQINKWESKETRKRRKNQTDQIGKDRSQADTLEKRWDFKNFWWN